MARFGFGFSNGLYRPMGAIGGGIDPPPAWLNQAEDEVGGVQFVDGEAYINGALITDLSEIFIGFDPSKINVDGYAIAPVTSPFLTWEEELLSLVAGFEFAVRVEFKTGGSFGLMTLLQFWTDPFTGGADVVYYDSSNPGQNTLYAADIPTGDYSHSAGILTTNTTYKYAASNNVEGWRSTLNGAASVLDPHQTVTTCNKVFIGTDGGHHWNGRIKKMTFRPNGLNDAELRAWCNSA